MATMEKFQLYHYSPSIPAASIFIVLFTLATCAHMFYMFRFKAWFFIPFIIGGCFEIIGYGLRIEGHFNRDSVPAFAGQSVLLLVAPPLFAATIYMILSRIIRLLRAETLSLIPLRWLTTIFVTSDVICFLVQGSGGGLQATGNAENLNTGKSVIIAGLILQVVIFCIFVVTAWNFHVRYSNRPQTSRLDWKRQMIALYVASGLILVRNIVRVVEYAQGFDGYIMTHEVFIYVFDAMLMWAMMVFMLWTHPGQFFEQARLGGGADAESWPGQKGAVQLAAHEIV